MTKDDAGLLMFMALRKVAAKTGQMAGYANVDTEHVAHQLRRDLGDEQLRAVVLTFGGVCVNGCDDPVSCCNVSASAVAHWLQHQTKQAKKSQKEAWAEATN